MQQFTWTVLDDYIEGEGPMLVAITPGQLDDGLGLVDQLVIEVTVTNVSGNSPTIDVQIEHSSDGVHWINKNKEPEINAAALEKDATNYPPFAFDDGTVPSLAFIRLRVTLRQVGVHRLAARVSIIVTGNDYRETQFAAAIHELEDESRDNWEVEQGDKGCAKFYDSGSWLPSGMYITQADYKYLDYDADRKQYRVKAPYSICEASDHLLTVFKGDKIVHSDTWSSASNNQEQSH